MGFVGGRGLQVGWVVFWERDGEWGGREWEWGGLGGGMAAGGLEVEGKRRLLLVMCFVSKGITNLGEERRVLCAVERGGGFCVRITVIYRGFSIEYSIVYMYLAHSIIHAES